MRCMNVDTKSVNQRSLLDIVPAMCCARHTSLTDRPGVAVIRTGGP